MRIGISRPDLGAIRQWFFLANERTHTRTAKPIQIEWWRRRRRSRAYTSVLTQTSEKRDRKQGKKENKEREREREKDLHPIGPLGKSLDSTFHLKHFNNGGPFVCRVSLDFYFPLLSSQPFLPSPAFAPYGPLYLIGKQHTYTHRLKQPNLFFLFFFTLSLVRSVLKEDKKSACCVFGSRR